MQKYNKWQAIFNWLLSYYFRQKFVHFGYIRIDMNA